MNSLTPDEKATGSENYYSAMTAYNKHSRRDFLKGAAVAGVGASAGAGALYFGYQKPTEPIRVCVIGTGDEGNVLIGAINPDYVQVTAICDIRPSSIHRAFHGDYSSPNAKKVRKGLIDVYGWADETEALRNVKIYKDWKQAVADKNIDAVIIATPLFLHAPIAVAAMQNGKHVLCEKLMAHNVAQCKLMTRVADDTRSFMSVGHQRHYSVLYDNAVNLIQWGLLGELHHIRAQWHRNNLPGKDSWALPIPGGELTANGKTVDKIADQLGKLRAAYGQTGVSPKDRLDLERKIAQWEQMNNDQRVNAAENGYEARSDIYSDGRTRSALEELIRWRLWDRTGGGLMAELGSHQLDAASIFISALAKEKGKHVHPLTVHAAGGRHIFPRDRDAADHVYCTFEFPGQGYDYDFDVGYKDNINCVGDGYKKPIESWEEDNNKKVVVTYSSINGNGFGGYGEVVMGTKGTMVLDKEAEVLLYSTKGPAWKAGVKKKGSVAVLDTTTSTDAAPAKAAQSGPVSRGYKEEIEHWAWCISTGDWDNQPRCNGPLALADACIALTARQAIKNSQVRGGHGFIQFENEWFDHTTNAVPEATDAEASKSMWAEEKSNLGLA